MTYAEFYKFAMDISLVDYEFMYHAALPAKAILDAADRVHVKGPGTDLRLEQTDTLAKSLAAEAPSSPATR